MKRKEALLTIALCLLIAWVIMPISCAEEKATDTAEWHYNQGVDLQEQGRYDEAIEEYNKAIELNPEFVEAYQKRGGIYNAEKNEFDKAIADFDKAIKLDPEFALAYTGRGMAYAFKHEFDKAIADFDKAIKLDPGAVNYFVRGCVYAEVGESNKAISDLEKCIELSKDPEMTAVAQQVLDELR
jgi:tetratricopeptide (TPR) repeat protein